MIEPQNLPPVLKHLLTLTTDAAEAANTTRLELLLDWLRKQINTHAVTPDMRVYARNYLLQLGTRLKSDAVRNSTWSSIGDRVVQVANEMTFRSIEPFTALWDSLTLALARGNTGEISDACKTMSNVLEQNDEPEEVFSYVASKVELRARQLGQEPGVEALHYWAGEWIDHAA